MSERDSALQVPGGQSEEEAVQTEKTANRCHRRADRTGAAVSDRESALRVLRAHSEEEAVQTERTAKALVELVLKKTTKPEPEQRTPTGPRNWREEPQRRPRVNA